MCPNFVPIFLGVDIPIDGFIKDWRLFFLFSDIPIQLKAGVFSFFTVGCDQSRQPCAAVFLSPFSLS